MPSHDRLPHQWPRYPPRKHLRQLCGVSHDRVIVSCAPATIRQESTRSQAASLYVACSTSLPDGARRLTARSHEPYFKGHSTCRAAFRISRGVFRRRRCARTRCVREQTRSTSDVRVENGTADPRSVERGALLHCACRYAHCADSAQSLLGRPRRDALFLRAFRASSRRHHRCPSGERDAWCVTTSMKVDLARRMALSSSRWLGVPEPCSGRGSCHLMHAPLGAHRRSSCVSLW
jgi:hypothetical protein